MTLGLGARPTRDSSSRSAAAPAGVVAGLGIAALLALPGAARADSGRDSDALASRATLTGDWGGQRSAWAERGIEFGVDVYGDTMAVTDGGEKRNAYYAGLVEAGAEFDLDALFGWPGTRAFVMAIGTFGADPADGAGSVHAPSNLANEVSTAKLLEAWIERDFFDGKLALLGGLYAVDSEFDVKETAGVFMNGGFGTGLELSETGLNGPCVYPTTCLGLRARYQPDDSRYLQLAVLDGVAGDPDDPRGTQIRLSSDDGLLILAEGGIQRGADQGRFLRAALGAWHYTTDLETLVQPRPEGPARTMSGTQGVYALLEGDLYREPGQVTQGLSGFLRIGVADDRVNQFSHYVGAGLVYTGPFAGRSEDLLGIGVSAAFNGDDFKTAQRLAGTPVDDREVAIELTYWMPVLAWLSLQLSAQHILNPSTDPALENATLVGLRYQVTF
jgi:porin